jgi:hypothetical protein
MTNQGTLDTLGVVKQFLAFVIHQILARSAASDGQRATGNDRD